MFLKNLFQKPQPRVVVVLPPRVFHHHHHHHHTPRYPHLDPPLLSAPAEYQGYSAPGHIGYQGYPEVESGYLEYGYGEDSSGHYTSRSDPENR